MSMRRLIGEIVAGTGDEVFEAEDTVGVISSCVSKSPDLILMDSRMEKLDIMTVTAVIKKTHPGSRVLVLSNFDDERLRIMAVEAGADAFIMKDNLLELKEIIRRLFV